MTASNLLAQLCDLGRSPTGVLGLVDPSAMNNTRADFAAIPWHDIAPGAREKRVVRQGVVLRLLEFSPPFVEHDWCTQSHSGYVIDGGLTIKYRDREISLVAGDGLHIAGGDPDAHKAIIDGTVLLFLIEPQVDESS